MGRPTEEEFVNEGLSAEEIEAFSKEDQLAPEPDDDGPTADALTDASQPPVTKPADQAVDEPKTVDVRALQEARAEARAAREEAARVRDERSRLEERLNIINQTIAQQQKQQAPDQVIPSKDEDLVGYLDHSIDHLKKELQSVRETEAQRLKAIQEEEAYNANLARASTSIDQAVLTNPQVGEALQFALEGLKSEIAQALAPHNLPPDKWMAEANRMYRQSMETMAKRVPQDPQGAAEYVMRNARYYGYGYQPQGQGQGQAQQPAATQQTRPSPQEIAARQERHMSLSSIQGGEAPQALTLEAVSKMSDTEFRKLCAKLGDEGLDKLMGAA